MDNFGLLSLVGRLGTTLCFILNFKIFIICPYFLSSKVVWQFVTKVVSKVQLDSSLVLLLRNQTCTDKLWKSIILCQGLCEKFSFPLYISNHDSCFWKYPFLAKKNKFQRSQKIPIKFSKVDFWYKTIMPKSVQSKPLHLELSLN